ncbi:MAG: hypothetical protein WKG06_13415 [Segetibacter sp.]
MKEKIEAIYIMLEDEIESSVTVMKKLNFPINEGINIRRRMTVLYF